METMVDIMRQMDCAGLTLERAHRASKVHRVYKVYKDFRVQTDLPLELSDLLLT